MTKKADAVEPEVKGQGADQSDARGDGFDEAFDEQALQPDGALRDDGPEPEKPAKKKAGKPETTTTDERPRGPDGKFLPVEDKPATGKEVKPKKDAETPPPEGEAVDVTALDKAEAAAKALDAKPPAKDAANPDEEPVDIMDSLPPEYAWAREARESGKLSEFLAKQPKAVQKIANSGDADDAVYFLDLYKKSMQPAPAAAPATTPAEKSAMLAQLGGMKFTAPDGTEKTLRAIADEYQNEELLEAIFSGVKSMIDQSGGAKTAQSDTGAIDKLQQRLDAMKAERDQEKALEGYMKQVRKAHSDVDDLLESGMLHKWVTTKGTDGLKRLYRSPNPDHGVLVLDAFKEAMAKEAGEPATESAAAKAKGLAALHGDSARSGRKPQTLAPKDGDDAGTQKDFDEGFDAGSKA